MTNDSGSCQHSSMKIAKQTLPQDSTSNLANYYKYSQMSGSVSIRVTCNTRTNGCQRVVTYCKMLQLAALAAYLVLYLPAVTRHIQKITLLPKLGGVAGQCLSHLRYSHRWLEIQASSCTTSQRTPHCHPPLSAAPPPWLTSTSR